VSLPSDQHYRAAVEALLRHPDTRLASVTVSGADGTTRVVRARGRSGFPASYLNPLGIAETGRALAGTDELIQIKEMRLAQRPDGHLVWRLAGRRDDNGAWAALIAPNGTGLRTIAPARR
jgi:hypothetical protein